jgi:hypothetical protein
MDSWFFIIVFYRFSHFLIIFMVFSILDGMVFGFKPPECDLKPNAFPWRPRAPHNPLWDQMGLSGLSGIIWDHLGSSGIIWDHLGSSGIIWDHLGYSGIIWDHLGSWDHLGPSGIIWNYLRPSGIIWN